MRLSIVVLIGALWSLRLGAAEDAGAPAPAVVAPPAATAVAPAVPATPAPAATAPAVPAVPAVAPQAVPAAATAKPLDVPVVPSAPAPSPYRTVHLANGLVDAEVSTRVGSLANFRLLQTHPIQLPKWQQQRLKDQGEAVPDHDAALAVLDDFHPAGDTGGSSNYIIGLGFPRDPVPWTVSQPDAAHTAFDYVDSDRHLTFRMAYHLPEGKTELETTLTIANTGASDVTLNPMLFPLNGIHQDDARSDSAYLTVAYHSGGASGSQSSLGMPNPDPHEKNHMVEVPATGLDYVCLKSRFFAALWAPGAATFSGGAPAPAKPSQDLGPEAPTAKAAVVGQGPVLNLHSVGFLMAASQGGAHQAYLRATWTSPGSSDGLVLHAGETVTIPSRIVIASMTRGDLTRLSEIERKVEYTDGYYRFFSLLAKILTYSLAAVVAVVRNYGVALLVLTLLLKLALHRTTFKQQESMMKMQKLQPEMKRLQEEYRNDRQKQGAKTMELYKKHGVSPLSGCLPIFIQIPVFTALYLAFSHSADMRGQSFLWINDLTLPDNLLWLGFTYPDAVPFVGGSLATINPLPLLYIAVTVWMSMSQKMPSGGDPQQEQMMKTMRWLPVVFGVIFYGMPSGLVLYFTANAVLSTIEIKMVKRKLGIAK